MALEERTRLYELLVRLGPDDTGDRIVGMQVQTITEVLRDGQIIAASLGQAQPVDIPALVALLHPADRAALRAALG